MSTPITEKRPPSPSTDSEASDILDLQDDEGWEDAEPEEEQLRVVSLFDAEIFPNILSMLEYCKAKYNFDFLKIRDQVATDFYDSVKLVNFIRAEVEAGRTISSSVTKKDFEDEKYLKPVFQDDSLLFSLDELPHEPISKSNDVPDQLLARVVELEEELQKSQSQFADYRETVKRTLDERWSEGTLNSSAMADRGKRDDDSHYFSSYSYNGKIFLALIMYSSNSCQTFMKSCSRILFAQTLTATSFMAIRTFSLAKLCWMLGAERAFFLCSAQKQEPRTS